MNQLRRITKKLLITIAALIFIQVGNSDAFAFITSPLSGSALSTASSSLSSFSVAEIGDVSATISSNTLITAAAATTASDSNILNKILEEDHSIGEWIFLIYVVVSLLAGVKEAVKRVTSEEAEQ